MQPLLEDVFCLSGVPTHTFVEPPEFSRLLIAIRTKGSTVVVEGPSGIGKSSAVRRALSQLNLPGKFLNARLEADAIRVLALPQAKGHGIVVVDDFHRLPDDEKPVIASYMKWLADGEDPGTKLVVLGINRAGESLMKYSSDLLGRISIIRMGSVSDDMIMTLIERGEEALNIGIGCKAEILACAFGSFGNAQLLCHFACLEAGVQERTSIHTSVNMPFSTVRHQVQHELSTRFRDVTVRFARGPRLYRGGRAPYLHLLKWLSETSSGSLRTMDVARINPAQHASVSRVIQERGLDNFMAQNASFGEVLHYDSNTQVLSAEDPKFKFYLSGIEWSSFASEVGYVSIRFDRTYDYALSFAGADRDIAEPLAKALADAQIQVFYDRDEQHLILGGNVAAYLKPIYASQAKFILILLSDHYPDRIWTAFETKQFSKRIHTPETIPIFVDGHLPGYSDPLHHKGALTIHRVRGIASEIGNITGILIKRIEEYRYETEAK